MYNEQHAVCWHRHILSGYRVSMTSYDCTSSLLLQRFVALVVRVFMSALAQTVVSHLGITCAATA
jgi:hypothetical protein